MTVVVEQHPIPTAQITIFLFEDNYPLNGTPDLPEEENPLAGAVGADGRGPVDWTQFSIILEEPAGLYGQNGGPVLQDAFGNRSGPIYAAAGPATRGSGPGWLSGHGRASGPAATAPCTRMRTVTSLVKNLAPGKYGVIVTPPGAAPAWQQVSTIEGTSVIDAWVKANEPPFFVEFGLPGPHVFVGFVQPLQRPAPGGATVSGTITDMHMSRSPDFTFYSGRPFPGCWVALNEGGAVPGRALYAAALRRATAASASPASRRAATSSRSSTPIWTSVIATQPLTVDLGGGTCNGGGSCDLGEVPVFNWFARLNTAIFNDTNQDGFWDAGEGPVGPEAGPVTIRWRDGTVYQSFPTDTEGFAPFDEVFPFFHWLVAEVGFTNKKATGRHLRGGRRRRPIDTATDAFPGFGELTPQPQAQVNPHTGNNLSRTETGPVLTQAFQAFLGQTNVCSSARPSTSTRTSRPAPGAAQLGLSWVRTAASPASCTTPPPAPRRTRASRSARPGSPASRASRWPCTPTATSTAPNPAAGDLAGRCLRHRLGRRRRCATATTA